MFTYTTCIMDFKLLHNNIVINIKIKIQVIFILINKNVKSF